MKKGSCVLLLFAFAFLFCSCRTMSATDGEGNAHAEFADDRILVVLTNEASISPKIYTTADFADIGCSEVKNLTQASSDMVQAILSGAENSESDRLPCMNKVNIDTFQKILCLTLEEPGRENVLKAIEQLEKRSDVESAEPDYVMSIVTPVS